MKDSTRRFLAAKTVPEVPRQFDRTPTVTQIRDGILLARQNAAALLADARALLALDSRGTAAALAILAMEEAAKEPILISLAHCKTDAGRRYRWRDFRAHSAKMAALWSPFGEAGADIDARQQGLIYLKRMSASFGVLKEFGLYTDLITERGETHWSSPQAMPASTVEAVIDMAEMVIHQREMSDAEITLFMKHVAPHADAESREFRRAVEEFEAAAISAGLRDVADPNTLPPRAELERRIAEREKRRLRR